MVAIRPVAATDLEPLLELAALAGVGLTTLPKDRALLKKRIAKSVASFAAEPERPGGESYLFVMEDAARARVVGACGVVSKVGGFEPFYGYRVANVRFESKAIRVCHDVPVLTLVAEHDGPCEIGSLFLHSDYRGGGNGRFLQLVRFLFMAEYPQRFETQVVSEIRGVLDARDESPFWNALGRHFFNIDFATADRLSVVNKKFIAELMPKHPIYIPLLPGDVQAIIGTPHKLSARAVDNLAAEGFSSTNTVDIFDAGPVVGCERDSIRAIRQSRRGVIGSIVERVSDGRHCMICTVDGAFRAIKCDLAAADPTRLELPRDAALALGVQPGASVRFVELLPPAQAAATL